MDEENKVKDNEGKYCRGNKGKQEERKKRRKETDRNNGMGVKKEVAEAA
jgi:hypothetical protein